ncbi:MAG: O-acetylhomoserine aminocarboxypropyltransferase/cysteine synthase [Clostridiales bacterium]|jgi:O-acetylhomoserine (thiol)-lyase|nr:O-acetylhomoserine aminocarboxypropyltransferase/cysteine synthase [Clostridiales bacterium]
MRIETDCVQAGYNPTNGSPRVLPIYQSTTYKYDSSEYLGDLFDLKAEGHIYSRISNPTLACVEEKIAKLESGTAAMLASSGQSAIFLAIANLCGSGSHVLSSSKIYGGTINLMDVSLRRLGIEISFIDPDAGLEEIRGAIKPNTKLIYGETISNPSLVVLDIEKFAKAAHENNIPLMIDNTFTTPILCRPFEFGADIVVHSASKYLDGHAVALGGVVAESGKFDWSSGKFPGFTTPDESYHGLIYSKDAPNTPFITKARVQLMRDYGAIMSPHTAFLLNLGLETLHLRMERHSENALIVSKFLESHPKIESVNYPGLESNKYHELQKKYFPKGSSGVVSFNIKGAKADCVKFMDNLKLAAIVTHVADARTGAIHPASTTHRQLSGAALKAAGIGEALIRLSVGLENVNDIIEDIENAL